MWLGTSAVMMFGFYRVGQGNREGVEQKVEERKVRYALAPLLQAESDKELLKREQQNLNREAEVMKDVPGWKVGAGVYNNGKWMPRAVAPLQHSIK